MVKHLSILGSTGSIGVSTLDIVAANPERYQVVALSAGRNLTLLEEQIRRFQPAVVAVRSDEDAHLLRFRLGGDAPVIYSGTAGLINCAVESGADVVVSAIVGAAGLEPTFAAVRAGIDVALANKETLVAAGSLVMAAAARSGSRIFPVDSEHSAIYQSLEGHRKDDVRRLILTASGGPFRDYAPEQLQTVSLADALAHPNWSMGRKITIDSATMMNKGLEVIEAFWLFDVPAKQIDVHIHPESIVHSMVEYIDGSVIAQLGVPDMKAPIAYALSYPERLELDLPSLDLCTLGNLQFRHPDNNLFPCLGLAYQALEAGGTAPAILNAANEVAVDAFLDEQISFLDIAAVIERVLNDLEATSFVTLEEVLDADQMARDAASAIVARHMQGALS